MGLDHLSFGVGSYAELEQALARFDAHGVARGEMHLTLDCPMDGHGRHACVSLHVDDVDAYFAEWSARVAVPAAPANQDWGARTFSVHDPSGNTLFVLGPRRDDEAGTAD